MARLWGDGFVDDNVEACWSMRHWDACSPDEYTIMFPRLLPSDGKLPMSLILHLSDCVSARLWRLRRLDPGSPAPKLRSCVPTGTVDLYRAWFADAGLADKLLRRIGLRRTPLRWLERERRVLLLIDDVLDNIQRGSSPDWTQDREAWFAFGSGIHPAYLWAESTIASARGYTAAWLGHLDRGRTALIPPVVADYLLDTVVGTSTAIDAPLSAMIEGTDRRKLARAASRRLAGLNPTVHFGYSQRVGPKDLHSAAPIQEDVLRHA